MKAKSQIHSLALSLLIIMGSLHAKGQLNPEGVAPGLGIKATQFNTFEYPLNTAHSILLNEDDLMGFDGGPLRTAISVPVNQDFFSLGQWINTPDGGRFYRVQLSSENAKAISVAFDAFFIPEHARLFFYSPEKEHVFGGYTHEDNPQSMRFPGPIVSSDKVIMEYHEPSPEIVTQKPVLHILELAHFYRDVNDGLKNAQIGASGPCHVNVNCPEGNQWQNQKRGVVRILVRYDNSYTWCSGSLINNTAQDGTPYVLTADHCGGWASDEDRQLWQFRFNFERPECANQGIPSQQSIPGATLMAKGFVDGGSDFQLVRLNFTPPPAFNPYYNGWDRNIMPPPHGVGIHHPAGDVKKISTYNLKPETINNAIASGFHLAYRSIWNIRWIATQSGHGVTQGGSSGSPLFNDQGLIVGTLTGGNTSCENTDGNNLYAKVYHHWETNGLSPERQLRPWLDPLGTGQMTLQGIDLYPAPSVRNLTASLNEDLSVTLDWDFPGFYQNEENWFANITNYTDVVFDTPERAVLFNINQQASIDTFYLTKLAHFFWEHPSYLWGGDNFFRFRVYNAENDSMLFESPVLTAINFQTNNLPVVYQIPEALTITGPFFVSIVPESSGHPSSLAMKTQNNAASFFGQPGNWQPLQHNEDTFEMLVSVFGSGVKPEIGQESVSVEMNLSPAYEESDKLMRFGADPLLFSRMTEKGARQKSFTTTLMENVKYYRIFRDSVLLLETENAQVFSFTDTEALIEDQTYHYFLTAIYDINPNNPFSPDLESALSEIVSIKIAFEDEDPTDPTLVNNIKENGLLIYPNPVKGFLQVFLPEALSDGVLEIIDSHGSIVKTIMLDGRNSFHADLSMMARGVYFVRLITGDTIDVNKIILH